MKPVSGILSAQSRDSDEIPASAIQNPIIRNDVPHVRVVSTRELDRWIMRCSSRWAQSQIHPTESESLCTRYRTRRKHGSFLSGTEALRFMFARFQSREGKPTARHVAFQVTDRPSSQIKIIAGATRISR